MKPIPSLNLNKHPYEVQNGALIDATNIIVSNDNAVIQSENKLNNTNLYYYINGAINNADLNLSLNEILYIIPCSRELILFCKLSDNTVRLFRYNEDDVNYNNDEDYVPCEYCTQIEYSGGEFVGTFTYNNRNLIIAFSEYGDDLNIPLRTINLGEYKKDLAEIDIPQLENTELHSICTEIIIPRVKTKLIQGIAYKGLYYIFIRYKISNDTYTQWFNTNSFILVDSFKQEQIFSYVIGARTDIESLNHGYKGVATIPLSDDTDISKNTFECNIYNLDNRYSVYQIGFINIRKDQTRGFRSYDINIQKDLDFNTFIFNSNNVVTEGTNNLISTYYNYFNIKTLINNSNRLYIGNYKENTNEELLAKNISSCGMTIKPIITKIENNNESSVTITGKNSYTIKIDDNNSFILDGRIDDNGDFYFTGTNLIVKDINGNYSKKEYLSIDGLHIEATYNNITTSYELNSNLFRFYPFKKNANNTNGVVEIISISNGQQIKTNLIDEFYTNNGTLKITKTKIISTSNNYIDISPLEIIFINLNAEDYIENIGNMTISNTNTLNLRSINPNEYYNFFVHFVDKYGNVSKGYNIGEFNLSILTGNFNNNDINLKTIYNARGELLIKYDKYTENNTNKYITPININDKSIESYNICNYQFSILTGNIPSDYIGVFISHEKQEKQIKYTGIGYIDFAGGTIKFYADELNYLDAINMNFNSFRYFDGESINGPVIDVDYGTTKESETNLSIDILGHNTYEEFAILSSNYKIADTFNNILNATNILITFNYNNTRADGHREDGYKIIELYNDIQDDDIIYNNDSKTLIPCSDIILLGTYGEALLELNPNYYISKSHAIIGNNNIFYNNGTMVYERIYSYYGDTYIGNRGDDNNTRIATDPLHIYSYYCYKDIPEETLQINNKPDITFFPTKGYDTEDVNEKGFYPGIIFDIRNTTDLFQQKNFSVDESYPKTLDNYNYNLEYNYIFPKNIRRSNIIQDESNSNAWRQFEIEQYKVINENKGDVIKLISIGYYFIVHTQGSMFLFNSTNSIKSNEEQNIQLSNVDIWDIDYKEVLTSQLGYAGIQEEYSGLVGNFGYVFYDREAKRIYKYDNNQIEYIDNDITNFVKKLSNDIKCNIVEDVQRNRLLFRFYNDDNNYILSYNYRTGTFVSRHEYGTNSYYRGFSTKENIYLISSDKKNIFQFNELQYNNCDIHIMFNANYQFIKYIEYLIYRLCRISTTSVINYSPVEGMNYYYAGSELRVYTDLTDTGLIDVSSNNNTNVNTIGNYKQPYWKLGNWHFNTLRNKLKDYFDNNNIAENMSRIYGNWFVVEFKFNINDNPNDKIEIENVDVQLINGESI